MELTAAGLFRIFTGFPFNHYAGWLREPMRGKDTNTMVVLQKIIGDKNVLFCLKQ